VKREKAMERGDTRKLALEALGERQNKDGKAGRPAKSGRGDEAWYIANITLTVY